MTTGGRTSKLNKKFNRCVKSILRTRGRTMKNGRLVTQKKKKGGAVLTVKALQDLRFKVGKKDTTHEDLKKIVDEVALLTDDANLRAASNAYGETLRAKGEIDERTRRGMILTLAMGEMAAAREEQARADAAAARAEEAARPQPGGGKPMVKARKGSTKESAAIAICTASVLHPRGKTLKRYKKGRLTTQRKFRGGEDAALVEKALVDKIVAELPTGSDDESEDVTIEVPEAKDNPAVDGIIAKLEAQKASKGFFTRIGQAAVRGLGDKGETATLVRILTDLKASGSATTHLSGLEGESLAAKLTKLYPMM